MHARTQGVFENCSSLTEITLTLEACSLGDNFFKGCTALRAVDLHDGVVEICATAFADCTSLTEINVAPLTQIRDDTFEGCSALEAKAKEEGFSSANEYVVKRAMPEGWAMRKGDKDALYRAQERINFRGVEEIEVPTDVTSLGARKFQGRISLRKVDMHDGVKDINWWAFYNCNSLTEIKVPPACKIHEGAFESCTALEALAKAEGYSAPRGAEVPKWVVERAMPEGYVMRKGPPPYRGRVY